MFCKIHNLGLLVVMKLGNFWSIISYSLSPEFIHGHGFVASFTPWNFIYGRANDNRRKNTTVLWNVYIHDIHYLMIFVAIHIMIFNIFSYCILWIMHRMFALLWFIVVCYHWLTLPLPWLQVYWSNYMIMSVLVRKHWGIFMIFIIYVYLRWSVLNGIALQKPQ